MRITRRTAINLLTVLTLGVVMVGWVVTQILGTGFDSPFSVTADFASSGGVFTNQEVTYRGVVVGRVGDLELNDDGVDIELLIEPEWEGEIPEDVIASVHSKSAVGEQFVNLTPHASSGPMLDEGDVIPRDQTDLPVDFQALLRSLDRVLRDVSPEQTRSLVQTLADGVGGRSDEIAAILESLGTLSDAFASVAPEQRRLLSNATTVGDEFLRTKDAFGDAIRAADDVFRGIGDEPEELKRLFAANDRFARAGLGLLATRGDELARGIGALADFVEFQLEEREQIERSLTYLPQFFHAIEDASIPWRSPDGREFYRIRVGQVLDNVPSTWPCKYKVPVGYERLPHERDPRRPATKAQCLPEEVEGDQSRRFVKSLVSAVQDWAAANPEYVTPPPPVVPADFAPGRTQFIWPLHGAVVSFFGPRDGRMHEGIDIDGSTGDPVAASADGVVAFAGRMDGFGRVVIVEHGGGFTTVYAHLSVSGVGYGQTVDQGEIVGLVGCSGRCTGPHLHFELHVDGTPVDPLPYLPGGLLYAPPQDGDDTAPEPSPQPSPSPSPSPTSAPDESSESETAAGD